MCNGWKPSKALLISKSDGLVSEKRRIVIAIENRRFFWAPPAFGHARIPPSEAAGRMASQSSQLASRRNARGRSTSLACGRPG